VIRAPCDSKPPPLWAQVLLAVAPVIVGGVVEMVKDHIAHKREQSARQEPQKKDRPS
jgi:hypothetical protein